VKRLKSCYTKYMGVKFNEETLVVLTTSPAGLGHLRVMNALKQGLSRETHLAEVGIVDKQMQLIHRLTSVNARLRQLMEFVQNNPMAEGGFTRAYREVLRHNPEDALHQLENVVKRQRPYPKKIIILCTHFGLAHQLAVVKEDLAEALKVEVVLAVVVTDDSPQLLWAVPGVDYEFVPSPTTRSRLMFYLEKITDKLPQVVVVPYPVDPRLNSLLTKDEVLLRRKQLSGRKMKVMIPISGAAVQLDYFKELITGLDEETYEVTVVAREADATRDFLEWCQDRSNVLVKDHWDDRQVVELYEQELEKEVYAVEITKPSEQAFKCLLTPETRGGLVLLFSDPVGRQEDDNLSFMRRHGVMPTLFEHQQIEAWVRGEKPLPENINKKAAGWRGLVLPTDGLLAAKAVEKLTREKILLGMHDFAGFMPGHDELCGMGVKKIWEVLGK